MANQSKKNKVLFYRRLITKEAGSNGGNLKLRDCFDHIHFSNEFKPQVYFSKDTVWYDTAGNHWASLKEKALKQWEVKQGDILFFSGKDWLALPKEQRENPPVPIINIVQPRQTRPNDKRKQFLQYPAIRIAKSQNGANILRSHGVNGPLYVIPDAIDLGLLPDVPVKDIDILVLGLKQPAFARGLFQMLEEWNSKESLGLKLYLQHPPKLPTRAAFLKLLSRAKIVACIPLETERGAEGFYLPALEAMALKCLVVCPHAIGNLEHCLDGINCIVPEFSQKGIVKGVQAAWNLEADKKKELLQNGLQTAERHRIENERSAILDLVAKAYDIWDQTELFSFSKTDKRKSSFLDTAKQFWFSLASNNKSVETNLILTGLPRSGTTLSCFLLSQVPNTVALNEPLQTGLFHSKQQELRAIKQFFKHTRHSLLNDGLAIARAVDGQLVDNNFSSTKDNRDSIVTKGTVRIEKLLKPNFTLGIKHISLFTLLLPSLQNEYAVYAMVRNPIAVLGSWNSVDIPAARGIVRHADRLEPSLANTLNRIDNLLDKQLYILNWYFEQYLKLPESSILRYENIITSGGSSLRKAVPEAANLQEDLISQNNSELYDSDTMKKLGTKLLKMENSCWQFYEKEAVEALIKF